MSLPKYSKVMNKYLMNLMTTLVITTVCVLFVSCGDDDDDVIQGQAPSSIIGTWRYNFKSGPRGYTAYSFFEDGTGLYFDKGNAGEMFTYTYISNPQSVNVIFSKYDKEQIPISRLTSNVLVLDGNEYKKTELTNAMLIIGEWSMQVDARNYTGKRTRVRFYSGSDNERSGTYDAKDYYNNDASDEWSYSFPSLSINGIASGTWSINGNRLSIDGQSQIAGEYIIESLSVNSCRLIRASYPNEYPYIIGVWHGRH